MRILIVDDEAFLDIVMPGMDGLTLARKPVGRTAGGGCHQQLPWGIHRRCSVKMYQELTK